MKFLDVIDSISRWSGRIVMFLMIPMIFVTVYDVALRYFFRAPTQRAYELSWMIYAAFFILSGAYTLVEEGHISVDVLLLMLRPRLQSLLKAIYLLVLLMPFAIVIIIMSIPWAWHSTLVLDCAEHTLWRPYVFPIKWTVPLGFTLLALQGLSSIVRNFVYAIKGDS
ncbi:MAG: TRAP transporter small permease subunit [Desulfobacteraceae bacterium]|nr:TRAP transporter small permease subunit [Desulfobacteraceae bacterium]